MGTCNCYAWRTACEECTQFDGKHIGTHQIKLFHECDMCYVLCAMFSKDIEMEMGACLQWYWFQYIEGVSFANLFNVIIIQVLCFIVEIIIQSSGYTCIVK